jgi:hypothetical protein
MPSPDESAAVLTLRTSIFHDTLERHRRAYEALAVQAYQAAGAPYRASLGDLPGALLWLENEAAAQGWAWGDWLCVWHHFLGELRRAGVVPGPQEAPK